ncbi:MAG: hypothetical protein E4G89_04175 [Methanothrix sp.]|nr:MAG: hypothetical protein E4G89_04175 [Methanothrix sp.]
MSGSVEPAREVPTEISYAIKAWYRGSNILRFLHISLGLIAIVLTITVASKVIAADDSLFPWIAWGAAIATGLLTSFNLGTKSNNMRNAWRILNEAKIRYEKNEQDMTLVKLVDAYRDGEKLIGDVVVNL